MTIDDASMRGGFCPLPWMHLSANTDTSMRVCCNTDHGGHVRGENGHIVRMEQVTSLKAAMNQKTHKDLRTAMLRGERPSFCKRCYVEEDNGGVSVRQIYNRDNPEVFAKAKRDTKSDGEIEPKVSYVDFSLSNNCNLQCRMCGPSASFLLQKEFSELGLNFDGPSAEMAKNGWSFEASLGRIVRDVAPSLKQMLTTGGEPFISPQHLKILETIVVGGGSRDVILRYHSNLTVLPDRLIELWRNFKSIEVHVSLEGVDSMNEYVRFPSKWEKIMAHLKKLEGLRPEIEIHCEIHTCLQALSWLRTHELMEWTFIQSEKSGAFFPRIPYPIWIDQPVDMTLATLPGELRTLGSDRILSVLDRHQRAFETGPNPAFELGAASSFRAAIQRLKELPFREEDFQAFLTRTSRVDVFRGQNLINHVPEFKPYVASSL